MGTGVSIGGAGPAEDDAGSAFGQHVKELVADIAADLRSPFERWRLWSLMARQDIGIRYKRSVLGPFWVSITMASFVLGVGLLYSQIFNQPPREYLAYLGSGLLAWFFIVGLVNEGGGAISESAANLRSVPLPIPLLMARVVWRNVVVFLHNAVVILAMMLLLGHTLEPIAALSIVGVALIVLIGFFAGIMLSPLCTRYRDVSLAMTNVMQVMFFLTPIHWTLANMPSRSLVIDINPFYHLVSLVRQPLLGEAPSPLSWAVAGGLVVLTFVLALVSLAVSRKKIHLWL